MIILPLSADKFDDIINNCYEGIGRLFDQVPVYHMKIQLGEFNTKRRENIFQPTLGNDPESNDNGIRLVNFPTSNNFTVKSKTFSRRNIHKYT